MIHEKTPKKAIKNKIVLKDGQELQFHTLRKPDERLRLKDYVPEQNMPVEVEIGAGSGRFISMRSKQYPDRFFIGIDRRTDRVKATQKKLSRNEEGNWVMLHLDARSFVSEEMPPIKILHIYHPDPWPKERHHKHRFFRSPDAKLWSQAIEEGGELRISTDHYEYFQEIMKIVESWELFDLKGVYQKRAGKAWSRFEEIFLSRNEPVFKAIFQRRALA